MTIRRIASLALTLAVAIPAIGQNPQRVPTVQELLPLVPAVSTRNQAVRSFAFDALLSSGGAEAMRTHGWYSGPGQLALLVLDEADGTPLLYAQGGNGVVYDALEARCLPFTYGSLAYFFGFADKEKTKLAMSMNVNAERSASGLFELDLRSCFTAEDSTVDVVGPGAYRLTSTGQESRASIRVAPGEAPPWGRFTLSSQDRNARTAPLIAIEIVDVNRYVSAERLVFPALQPFTGQVCLTAFPETDEVLNRVWNVCADALKHKAPAELRANSAALLTPQMKQAWLAQMLAHRSHWVRIALRDPSKRATLTAGKGDVSLIPSNKTIDWNFLASHDKTIAASLREMLKQQTPLR